MRIRAVDDLRRLRGHIAQADRALQRRRDLESQFTERRDLLLDGSSWDRARVCYALDPDGRTIEFVERPEAAIRCDE